MSVRLRTKWLRVRISLLSIKFNVFYVIMTRVPIAANFKQAIYEAFNLTNLTLKRCKTLKI